MKITVTSGKGGTGKTLISTSLALSLSKKYPTTYIDLDVEEPNGYIFIKPKIQKKEPITLPFPKVDYDKCNFCGVCQEVCAYNAIAVLSFNNEVKIFPELCKSCGNCVLNCPEKAMFEVPREIGTLTYGKRENLKFFEGKLNISEVTTTSAIRIVKKKSLKETRDGEILIYDSPPGASCPMVEASKGGDYIILITEPTPFGLFDLKIAVGVVKGLNKKFGVIINKEMEGFDELYEYLKKENIKVLLKIPFERKIAESYSKGKTLSEIGKEWEDIFLNLYNQILEEVND